MKTKILSFCILLSLIPQSVVPITKRTVTSQDGLSSMFVMSLIQDSIGYIWAGTYNGISILEGNNSHVIDLHGRIFSQLNGHVVEGIQYAGLGEMWFHSNFGLTYWKAPESSFKCFPEINSIYSYSVSPHNEVIVASQERGLLYYNARNKQFQPFEFKNLKYIDVLAMNIDGQHLWHVLTRQCMYSVTISEDNEGNIQLKDCKQTNFNQAAIRQASIDGDHYFCIDNEHNLYLGSLNGGQPKRLFQLSRNLQQRGDISAIIRYGKDVAIGFATSGVVLMHNTGNSGSSVWEETPLDIQSGVFDLKYDSRQDILWAATDGEGICYFFNAPTEIRTQTLLNLPFSTSAPVRAIQKDKNGDLWVATKGDGLIRFQNYNPKDGSSTAVVNLNRANSPLLHNSVYCLAEGKNGIIWMGTDGNGVNYYLPGQRKMGTLTFPDLPMYNVHGITEADSRLWVATWGHGAYCIELNWQGDTPVARQVHQLLYDPAHWELGQFLAVQADGHNVWLASRENGITQIEGKNLTTNTIHFNPQRLSAINDVVTLNTQSPQGIICATSAGLILQPRNLGEAHMNLSDSIGIVPEPVRAVIYDKNHDIWFSSPHSLTVFNMQTQTRKDFGFGNEIGVSEFVEGAAFYDSAHDIKYFGGTNGFVVVRPCQGQMPDIHPEVLFHDILLPKGDLLVKSLVDDALLELSYDNNTFTVKYDAIDYINAADYRYEYQLKGVSSDWIPNGHSHSISFSHLHPGRYTLQVRYRKGTYVSPVYELHFRILPPWWLSWPMKLLFWLLILATATGAAYMYVRRQRQRQQHTIDSMNEHHREEVYESKLRFFTNLTHEFSTPLTLISGPCQRILDMNGIPEQVKEYASIIRHSSLRLNNLIQQIIEYRRIDTGNREMHIAEENITDRLAEIITLFTVEAEKSGIIYKAKIQPDIIWPTDTNAFTTIAINLISNAFKYVQDQGEIHAQLCITENDRLQLTVCNSGRGISQEEIERMFNRYIILEDLEDSSQKRGFARNGLGLAIVKGLVERLSGEIDVKGEPNLTTFTVTLPRLEVNTGQTMQSTTYTAIPDIDEAQLRNNEETPRIDPSRATVLVVDDDPEMLWFLKDILQERYNVLSYTDPTEALKASHTTHIDLILSDIIMTPIDGIELCRSIKAQSTTSHVPVILLSSDQSDNTRRATAEAGAELFVSKPFDLEYFRSVVQNQLKRNTVLKEYFNSSLSAFQLVEGKQLHQEEKEMLDRLTKLINDNLENPELSSQFIAKEMGIGLRNIYRKLGNITSLTPKEMIREARLERARQLLVQTSMSMEEVCFKAGFNNRGTFYKLFSTKFGCTPKQYHEQALNEAKEKFKG